MDSEDPLQVGDDSDIIHGKEIHRESPHTPLLDSSLQAGVEIEEVGPEEFDFLDTVTQQAALQSGKLDSDNDKSVEVDIGPAGSTYF